MNIHTAKGGQNLTELAQTLYKLETARAPKAGQTAVDVLLKANPQLAKAQVVPAGTLIMAPDIPGYKSKPSSDPGHGLGTSAARQLREVLGQVGEVLGAALDDKETSDEETARQLKKMAKDKGVLAPQGGKIAGRLKSIEGATKERAKLFGGQRTVQKEGIAQLEKDLATFLQIHER